MLTNIGINDATCSTMWCGSACSALVSLAISEGLLPMLVHAIKSAVVVVLVFFGLALPQHADAYSVLSHEANVDALWDSTIAPMLRARFPNASAEQIQEARGYAYGGCVIQDLGYYPFGSHFFSNLLHYVRSGDFVEIMIRESTDIDEYAFSLGRNVRTIT